MQSTQNNDRGAIARVAGAATLMVASLLAASSKDDPASLAPPKNGNEPGLVIPAHSDGKLLLVDRDGHWALARDTVSRVEAEPLESLRNDRDFGARLIDLRIAIDSDSQRIERLHGSSDPRLSRFAEIASALQDFQYSLGNALPENPESTVARFLSCLREYRDSLAMPYP